MSSKKYRILTEASGSITSGYLIKSIKSAGHISICSDINPDNAGKYLADEFITMPKAKARNLWDKITEIVSENAIDIVIPSLDETLLGWAERKDFFEKLDIHIITSSPTAIDNCLDKWKTFNFFESLGIPTPRTSLAQEYELIKPRFGRGGNGVLITSDRVPMEDNISQEVVKGTEFTIDVFCDSFNAPIYIVPRRRLRVVGGKSTAGIVEEHEEITSWVKEICRNMPFIGPINLQCFLLQDGSIKFLEINPRIAGGMALGFAATENWIDLIVKNLVEGIPVRAKPIRNGLRMERYYDEIFIP